MTDTSSHGPCRAALPLAVQTPSRPLGLAFATAVLVAVLTTSAFLVLPDGRAQTAAGPTPTSATPEEPCEPVSASPALGQGGRPATLDLQRQVNELRSDLLDERERQIDRQLVVNAAALVLLGIVIGVGGLWFYAKIRAIAVKASIGAGAARHYVLVPPGTPLGPGTLCEPPGETLQSLPLLASARLEANPGTRARANGSFRASSPPPRSHVLRHPFSSAEPRDPAGQADLDLDDADLHRLEETIADCTEAIRADPDSPRLYLVRAAAHSKQDRYEEAVADYDRAIRLDPDHAAAYLGRCHAKSELGRHEEAIEDYDHAVHLDPASASASGDR